MLLMEEAKLLLLRIRLEVGRVPRSDHWRLYLASQQKAERDQQYQSQPSPGGP